MTGPLGRGTESLLANAADAVARLGSAPCAPAGRAAHRGLRASICTTNELPWWYLPSAT